MREEEESYRSHSAEKATVAEENDEEGDGEMEDKHVDDERGVVDLGLGGVVVDATGALHPLRDVPASTHNNDRHRHTRVDTVTHASQRKRAEGHL